MGTGPLFIGGLSYSGKTYLRLMLQAHPRFAVTRRSKMWPRYYGRFGDLARDENLDRCLATMLDHPRVLELQPDPARIRRDFRQGAPTYARLFALFHAHHAARAGKARWGDQLGGVEAFAGVIFDAFPDARMIHMVRDPRTRLADNLATARRRRARLGWETAAWRHSVRLARANLARYPDRYRVVHYEALLGRPEQTLRDICAFLDEPFAPAMLAVEGVPDLPDGAPGDGRGDGRGDRISDRELALLLAGAGREMRALDYAPRPPRLSVEDRVLLPIVDWPVNLAGRALWWVREGALAGVRGGRP